MLQKILIAIGAIAAITPAVHGEIVWLEKEYDYGLFKEEAGPKTGFARFVNTGPEEVCILGVKPSCGCTSADYTKDPIAPGDTATVSFTYDPTGRPGRFNKSVRVYVTPSDTYKIAIRGNVLGTPQSLSTLYPVVSGPLRLTTANVFAGDIKKGTARHFFVNGYNHNSDSIQPKIVSGEKALSVIGSAEKIGPGDIVTYSLYLNTRELPATGAVDIPVRIYPRPEENEEEFIKIHLTANIQ